MADIGKTTGGSPWDEPLPENTQTAKSAPTVVGDLDVNKQPAAVADSTDAAQPAGLNIPIDTDEKVGAKVDVSTVAQSAPSNVAPAPNPAAAAASIKTGANPVAPQPAPAPSPAASSNFWQSVYGQAGNPDGVAPTAVPSSVQVQAQPSAQKPVVPNIAKPVMPPPTPAAAPNITQPVPNIAPAGQVPIQSAAAVVPPAIKKPGNKVVTYVAAGVIGLVILFAGGIFLTEKGLISVGLEKIYGAVRLEALWGGLPANAENAFAISAVKMKSEPNFKISGDATITVNKGIKSNLISPIVSVAAFPLVALKDEQIGPKIKAILAVTSDELSTDPSSDLFQDTSSTTGSTDTSNSQDSSSTSSSDSSSSSGSSTDTSTPSISAAGSSDSSADSDTDTGTSTVEELTTNISAQVTDSVSGVNIGLKSSKSSDSSIKLVYSKNKMYLNTSSDINYDTKAKGGWVSFDLNKFGSDAPGSAFWGSKFSGSDFSLVGSRGNSETVNGVRCFHYSGKATIGSALESFGLGNNSVSNLDADYWLGVNDHLIHKLTMKIIPGSQSAVARIDITLNFSDYGNSSADFLVPATSLPYTGITAVATADLATAKGRDTKRKADLASIAKALESSRGATGKYPVSQASEKIAASAGTLYSSLVPTYLTILPIDPKSPTNYYGYKSDGSSYTLTCVLEDTTDTSGKMVGSVFLYSLSSL